MHVETDINPLITTGLHTGPVGMIDLAGLPNFPNTCGGECVFLGRTRRETHPEFGELLRLEYEIYEPMAVKLMDAMARDAAQQFDARAVRLVHAKGPVAIGEASVVIQAAAPHRSEAFAATRYLIDRLKHELPIWKHEIWRHGKTVVQGCPPPLSPASLVPTQATGTNPESPS